MTDFTRDPDMDKEQLIPDQNPDPVFSNDELVFTADEKRRIERWKSQYPTVDGAIMRALWLAQEKFQYLPPEVIRLTAGEVGIPYAQAYGVATFYTQYFKKKKGVHVLDVCTCFSCQLCGGYDILHYLESKLGIQVGETTDDGLFTLQEAECLGACGSAPMLQVTNGRYVLDLTTEKVDALLDALREGRTPEFTSATLPQDEDDLGGNRRSDVNEFQSSGPRPVSETVR
ncbi:MAG: NAD(P)H-dependent oxidoreductase subunit E [Bacteroidetes bacterium]|nr:MAG: NAD(P)H-dependent oxidoreductase subunit E [Bacteroidota bacterium]